MELVLKIRRWGNSLGRVASIAVVVVVSVVGLAIFYLPPIYRDKQYPFAGAFAYLLAALFGLGLAKLFDVPTLKYFSWHRHHWGTYCAFGMAGLLGVLNSWGTESRDMPLSLYLAGVLYVVMVGVGEEFVDRVFIFGYLQRFGVGFAVVISSFNFGLTHLNLYWQDWDGWAAYRHVMSATGFGFMAVMLLLITRTVWLPVFVHAIYDWSIIFDVAPTGEPGKDLSYPVWQGVAWGFFDLLAPCGVAGLLMVFIYRGRWPKWVLRLAIRWKLVEQVQGL